MSPRCSQVLKTNFSCFPYPSPYIKEFNEASKERSTEDAVLLPGLTTYMLNARLSSYILGLIRFLFKNTFLKISKLITTPEHSISLCLMLGFVYVGNFTNW
jgi:hypothetical protein